MRIPARPPDAIQILSASVAGKPGRHLDFLIHGSLTDDEGRYLHWDDLRRKPPPHGLSVEEWWAATWRARRAARQLMPLKDASNAYFALCEPPPLKAILRDLDMRAGNAFAPEAAVLSSDEARRDLARSLAEEPFTSSFIEGAATTRQIAKKLIFEGRAPRTRDEKMVLNNYEAMRFVKARKDTPLTLEMLLELHRIVTVDTLDDPADAGRIRTTDDIRVVDESSGEVLHQPPAATDLKERLKHLIEFANAKPEARNWIHPLVRAFILHFMLSYEHPFIDGNGRVARALFYWLALRDGYWLIEYVSISSVIADSKVAYGKAFLHTETDSADLTYFLIYHADILVAAVGRLMEFAERKRKEIAAFEKRLADRPRSDAFNHRQSWLLNELARGRVAQVTIQEHGARHAVGYLTARKDLETLVSARCLRKKKIGKSSIYTPVGDLMKALSG